MKVTQKDKIGTLGGLRSGKTTWWEWLLPQFPRYLAWDPTWKLQLPGVVHTVAEAEQAWSTTGRAILQPRTLADFEAFCALAMRVANTMIFVDEPGFVMRAGKWPEIADQLACTCHKRGNGLGWAAHRFPELPMIWRDVDHYVIFRLNIPSDVAGLEAYTGPEGVAAVADLKRFAWYYHRVGGEPSERGVQVPIPKPAPRQVAPAPAPSPPPSTPAPASPATTPPQGDTPA